MGSILVQKILEEKGHPTPIFLLRESHGLQRAGHDWSTEPMHRSSRNRRGLYKQYYYVRSNQAWHDRLWEETVKILLSFFLTLIMMKVIKESGEGRGFGQYMLILI